MRQMAIGPLITGQLIGGSATSPLAAPKETITLRHVTVPSKRMHNGVVAHLPTILHDVSVIN
jgi:hypothetical protein